MLSITRLCGRHRSVASVQLRGGKRYFSRSMPELRSTAPLVWIDCEMTGLDVENDEILSVACYVTDSNLNLMDSDGFEAIVHHSPEKMLNMGEWCRNQHGSSGLTASVLESKTSPQAAARGLLHYIQSHVAKPRVAMLAGNSVHADKDFLRKEPYKPVIDHLHYRILDVSSIKEAAKRWAPDALLEQTPAKRGTHTARTDILESIDEARFYQQALFNSPSAHQNK